MTIAGKSPFFNRRYIDSNAGFFSQLVFNGCNLRFVCGSFGYSSKFGKKKKHSKLVICGPIILSHIRFLASTRLPLVDPRAARNWFWRRESWTFLSLQPKQETTVRWADFRLTVFSRFKRKDLQQIENVQNPPDIPWNPDWLKTGSLYIIYIMVCAIIPIYIYIPG